MRIYVASTSAELAAHRAATIEAILLGGYELAAPEVEDDLRERKRVIARSDLIISLIGWRHGEAPSAAAGGDGRHSWTELELRCAFDRAQPVVVLQADSSWSEEFGEDDPVLRSWVADLRAELDRLAIPFAPGDTELDRFRDLVGTELVRHSTPVWLGDRSRTTSHRVVLRSWNEPPLPARPYPLLLPCAHPRLFAGRRNELESLEAALRRPTPILGIFAPSGAGKSSLLEAGLVPMLRASDRPVALERHPHEPGIVDRLVGDLVAGGLGIGDDDPRALVDLLLGIARKAGQAPVLILDQFEELLRTDTEDRRRARAVVGCLLAASTQRQPRFSDPPCIWVLAYRQECHGSVLAWLEDSLREARAQGFSAAVGLPHDLSDSNRFVAWPLPMLGAPPPGTSDPLGAAQKVFEDAILTPLRCVGNDGSPCYGYRFAEGDAERLALAFARARLDQPQAPLAPELQVVLAQLFEEAGEPSGDEPLTITVPEKADELIDRALDAHLHRALESIGAGRLPGEAIRARTRALLVLRELADAEGRRIDSLPAEELARAIGSGGRAVLEELAEPRTRLVVPDQTVEGRSFKLSHDRLAEVVVRLVEEEGGDITSGLDRELLGLRRFVALRTALLLSGEERSATDLSRATRRRIAETAPALLWCDDRRRWWKACQSRHLSDRRRWTGGWVTVIAIVIFTAAATWTIVDRHAHRHSLLELISTGDPEAAVAALAELIDAKADPVEIAERLHRRDRIYDLAELGLGGVPIDRRAAVAMELAELSMPLVAAGDFEGLAANIWALEIWSIRDDELSTRAIDLRERLLAPLRELHNPPDDPRHESVALPSGSFWMGSLAVGERNTEDTEDERPRHQVQISAFRVAATEVSNAEMRRLLGDQVGPDELPTRVDWYTATVYAAWLGGRLPTEAEWEYAARFGCDATWCDRHGRPVQVSEVAWWFGNSMRLLGDGGEYQPSALLEANPAGLFDLFGNAKEWTADWYGPYTSMPTIDPVGPTASTYRIARGGDVDETEAWVQSAGRLAARPTAHRGLRVVFDSNP